MLTAVAAGNVTITATSGGSSGTSTVTVTDAPATPVASLTVAPTTGTLTEGGTLQFAATPRDASGAPLTGRSIVWSTSSGTVASVSTTGLVTAESPGSATITATSEGRSGTAALTVTDVPVSTVTVTPSSGSMAVGSTSQLTATPRNASGAALTGRTVTWSTSAGSVATVGTTGLVAAQGVGSATITATSEGKTGTAAITVSGGGGGGGGGGGSNHALQFYANVLNGKGRVTIPLDAPARAVDIGATDFTIEFWLQAQPGANNQGTGCGGSDALEWIGGNIVLDRDRGGLGRKYGLSLLGGRVTFGYSTGSDNQGRSICGGPRVDDGQWHHVGVTRRVASGATALFIDGVLVASATGPAGDISYPNGTGAGGNDPYLVLAAEKHDIGPQWPGFRGQLDELRLSTTVRYTGNFTRPTGRFTPDAQTAALYHFDEGQGTTLGDQSGAAGGPSDGTLRVGGSPAGPTWVVSGAPTGP